MSLPTTGLLANWKASAGVSVSGSNVTGWADQSGNARNIATITGTPTLVSVAGVPWIRFNGSSYMAIPSGLSTNLRSQTVLIVYRVIGSALASNAVVFSPGPTGAVSDIYLDSTKVVAEYNGVGNNTTLAISDGPQMLGLESSATNNTELLDAETATTAVNGAGSVLGGFIATWGNNPNTLNLIGDIAEIAVWDHVLSGSDLAIAQAYFTSTYKVGGTSSSYYIVFDGDSITAGFGLTAPITDSYYPIQLCRFFTDQPKFIDIAVNGDTLQNRTSVAGTAVDPNYAKNSAFGAGRWVKIFAGTNDIFNGTETDTGLESLMTTYVGNRHTTGWKVCASTILKRSGMAGNLETYRTNFNAWLKANSVGADAVSDPASDFRFADTSNTNWYQADGTHPTAAGANVIAQYDYKAITGTKAVSYGISGPSSGSVGEPVTLTLTASNGTFMGETITPSDGSGGSFSPSTIATGIGSATATVQYTPNSSGAKTLTFSNNGILADPTFSFSLAGFQSMIGQLVRGEYIGTPVANTPTPISMYDVNGAAVVIQATQRLVITSITISAAAGNINVFFDILGNGTFQAGTSIESMNGTNTGSIFVTFPQGLVGPVNVPVKFTSTSAVPTNIQFTARLIDQSAPLS